MAAVRAAFIGLVVDNIPGRKPWIVGGRKEAQTVATVEQKPEFEGTGHGTCGCDQRRQFRPWQGCRIPARFRGEAKRGTSAREKERDAGKGVAPLKKTATLANRR